MDEIIKNIRKVLATIYPDPDSAAEVADAAGLDLTEIARHNILKIYWKNIVERAHKDGKIQDLLKIAIEDNRGVNELDTLLSAYQTLNKSISPAEGNEENKSPAKRYLKTLGGLNLESSQITQPKTLMILVYLAIEGSTILNKLDELFFDGRNETYLEWVARAFSQIALPLKKKLNKLVKEGLITIDDGSCHISPDIICDFNVVEGLLKNRNYQEAVAQYTGLFLERKDSSIGERLNQWITGLRTNLAKKIREAHLEIAEDSAREGNYKEAGEHAEKAYFMLEANTSLERIYTLLMAGENLRTADKARDELEKSGNKLILTPDEARERLRQPSAVPNNLQSRNPDFVERITKTNGAETRDREAFAELLCSGKTRLLTLYGSGGIGKSALADEIAHTLKDKGCFKDGIFSVSLGSVTNPDEILPKIEKVIEQPISSLKHKNLLLVLDNFEQFIKDQPNNGVSLIKNLLSETKNLCFLITSIKTLELDGEVSRPLDGLSYPSKDVLLEEARTSPSIILFEKYRKKKEGNFNITNENLYEVIKICELVDGIPLALKLAASSRGQPPLADIIANIEKNIDVLEATHDALEASEDNTPKRQRSMTATFDYSWELLSEEEQLALRRLSVFEGGFTSEVAVELEIVTQEWLDELVENSMLMRINGRYKRHKLIHKYTKKKLSQMPDLEIACGRKHEMYFLDYLFKFDDDLTGDTSKDRENLRKAIGLLSIEKENIRAAWKRAIGLGDVGRLKNGLETIVQFAEVTGAYNEANEFAEQILESAKKGSITDETLIGAAWSVSGFSKYRTLDNQLAIQNCQKAIELLSPPNDSGRNVHLWLAYLIKSICTWQTGGGIDEGRQGHENGLRVAEDDLNNAEAIDNVKNAKHATMRMGLSLHNLGLTELYYGDFLTAKTKEYLIDAKAKGSGVGAPYVCYSYLYLGELYLASNQLEDAKKEFENGFAIAKGLNYLPCMAIICVDLGKLLLQENKLNDALQRCEEAEKLCEQSGDMWPLAVSKAVRGEVALQKHEIEQAETYFLQSVDAAAVIKAPLFASDAILGLAKIFKQKQDFNRSVVLLSYLTGHAATPIVVKTQAQSLIEINKEQMPLDKFESAMQKGQALTNKQFLENFRQNYVDL